MKHDRLALLADSRLPGDGRVMAFYLLELGEGWHEVAHDDWRSLLDGPSDDTIRRHLRKLESTGWIEARTNTGRRPPQYRIRPRAEAGPFGGFRDALLSAITARMPSNGKGDSDPMALTHAGGAPSAPHPFGGSDPSDPNRYGAEVVDPASVRGKGSSSSSSSTDPPPPPLDARAREWVESSEMLKGCRGSLLDYLAERVEPERQLAYAQTVAGWIQGTDEGVWFAPGGRKLDREERAKVIGGCLNELRSVDEIGRFFTGPPGAVRNLRGKIRYSVKAKRGAEADAARHERRDDSAGTAAATRGQPRGGPPSPDVHVER